MSAKAQDEFFGRISYIHSSDAVLKHVIALLLTTPPINIGDFTSHARKIMARSEAGTCGVAAHTGSTLVLRYRSQPNNWKSLFLRSLLH